MGKAAHHLCADLGRWAGQRTAGPQRRRPGEQETRRANGRGTDGQRRWLKKAVGRASNKLTSGCVSAGAAGLTARPATLATGAGGWHAGSSWTTSWRSGEARADSVGSGPQRRLILVRPRALRLACVTRGREESRRRRRAVRVERERSVWASRRERAARQREKTAVCRGPSWHGDGAAQ